MVEIFLHIGGEKTGTTALQRFLTDNASVLLDRNRTLYPTNGPLFWNSCHHVLASAFLNPEHVGFVPTDRKMDRRGACRALDDVLSQPAIDRIILSAEHFSSRFGIEQIRDIRSFFADLPVTIVYYARRQDDLVVGALGEALKSGNRRWYRFDSSIASNRYYNHFLLVEDWVVVFGLSNIVVRSYDEAKHNLAHDFLTCVGIPDQLVGASSMPVTNVGLTVLEARVLYLLSYFLPTWAEAVSAGYPARFARAQRIRRKVLRGVRLAQRVSSGKALTSILSADDRRRIMDLFEDDNRRLRSRYGVRIPRA